AEAWTDDHLNRAITACGDNAEVKSDLMKRIDLLRNLRRQFRAFIIDEYQDTNPQHFRLLARLWGRRKLESDEPPPPAGDWDPTICIVGDMKQSIYRFRQAEVTVMRRAVDYIRRINSEELLMENRMNILRKSGFSRDPRPIPGKGGRTSTFESAKDLASEDSKREEWISHKLDDFDHNLSSQSEARRAEGHIEMSTNYRTSPRLLETMNNIFQDTFDERHHTLPGPWHAEAQNLLAGKPETGDGKLEWILPARTSELDLDLNPQIPKNPFIHQGSKDIELCADLLAQRLSALLNKSSARVFDSENKSWIDVSEPDSIFRPEDVMILVASRKRIPLLVKALEKYGVPAMADKQGLLLHRPVIKPLMSMLELLINPFNRVASLGIARSVIVGLTDEEISNFISDKEANQLDLLIENSPTESIRILLTKVKQLSERGNIRKAIDTIVDYSDLLYFYPKEGDRQDVENWLNLFDQISKLVGNDPAIICNRLKRLIELENDGPKSSSPSASGAVEILTIHSSKGLQSPIVVLYDLFSTGTRDSSFASNENVLVTPNIVAGRIHPWKGDEKPESGSWTLASMFDNGQQLAERRRQFYVSLTRAEKRLIIAGGIPEKTKTDSSGAVEIRRGDGRQTMGTMFLDGLAYSSIQAGNEGCPWSNEGIEQTNQTLTLNPGELYQNSYLSSNSVQSISIFHQPECFETNESISIVDKWRARYESVQNVEEVPEEYSVQNSNFSLPLASHSLDNTWSCRRRYWLSSISNWNSERFDFIPSGEANSNWPKATEFGSLFHRLLEIGLPNPGSKASDLDSTWVSKQEDKLSDEKVLSEVLAQSTITDQEILANTKQRLHKLGEITRNGNLGLLTLGKEFDGFKVEGLRTELPFYLSITNSPEGLSRHVWTPKGDLKVSDIQTIETIFNGRIDLVLALENQDGTKYLQVVDSKTTGCLESFNSEDADMGHR
ncbi:MAG: 3'-5' exonuclease, partial [Euryarchaeota archaeon]